MCATQAAPDYFASSVLGDAFAATTPSAQIALVGVTFDLDAPQAISRYGPDTSAQSYGSALTRAYGVNTSA